MPYIEVKLSGLRGKLETSVHCMIDRLKRDSLFEIIDEVRNDVLKKFSSE